MVVYWLSVAFAAIMFITIMVMEFKTDNTKVRHWFVGFVCLVYSVAGIVFGATVGVCAEAFVDEYLVAYYYAEDIKANGAEMDEIVLKAHIDEIDAVNNEIMFNRNYKDHWYLGALCSDKVAELPIINYKK